MYNCGPSIHGNMQLSHNLEGQLIPHKSEGCLTTPCHTLIVIHSLTSPTCETSVRSCIQIARFVSTGYQ